MTSAGNLKFKAKNPQQKDFPNSNSRAIESKTTNSWENGYAINRMTEFIKYNKCIGRYCSFVFGQYAKDRYRLSASRTIRVQEKVVCCCCCWWLNICFYACRKLLNEFWLKYRQKPTKKISWRRQCSVSSLREQNPNDMKVIEGRRKWR